MRMNANDMPGMSDHTRNYRKFLEFADRGRPVLAYNLFKSDPEVVRLLVNDEDTNEAMATCYYCDIREAVGQTAADDFKSHLEKHGLDTSKFEEHSDADKLMRGLAKK